MILSFFQKYLPIFQQFDGVICENFFDLFPSIQKIQRLRATGGMPWLLLVNPKNSFGAKKRV
jgi:hypothetical protein